MQRADQAGGARRTSAASGVAPIAPIALAALLAAVPAVGQQDTIVVGSKNFTESAVLAEIVAQLLEQRTDLRVERRINLGGTMICWQALQAGEIDVYAEYTGTGWAIVLKEPGRIAEPLQAFLHVRREYAQRFDVRWLEPFGFENTYALAMPRERAAALGIGRISDLLAHDGELSAGFSIEFMHREDGWPGLRAAYDLQFGSVRSLEHGLAYQAIASSAIDVIDAYSTDGKLRRYGLTVLADDRGFFPPYHAAPLVRGETLRRHPEIEGVLGELAFRLPDDLMQGLNYVVEEEGVAFDAAARAFLERVGLIAADPANAAARAAVAAAMGKDDVQPAPPPPAGSWTRNASALLQLIGEHLALALSAVVLAALAAIPLGIAIVTRVRLRRLALGAANVLQTVPSLALLALMIPVLGLSPMAAIVALFLYALLPILRNTYTGIVEVDRNLLEAARGMGMRPEQVLRLVQLPLAMRTIMAGIRTSTVISIGVATLATFIGAGGLGDPIAQGLYLNDTGLILTGAIPAAALAVLVDFALARVEQVFAV